MLSMQKQLQYYGITTVARYLATVIIPVTSQSCTWDAEFKHKAYCGHTESRHDDAILYKLWEFLSHFLACSKLVPKCKQ